MPIVAAPKYLTDVAYTDSSPGMHFSQLFRFWNSDWSKPKEGKAQAIRELCKLPNSSIAQLKALADRAKACRSATPVSLTLEAEAVAPFATGLGNEHPLENGFAFLNPYGLPYLAGSGVKGVLRQAARELASDDWGHQTEWEDTAIEALFGKESDDSDVKHFRDVLSFWDVIPQLRGDSLSVKIMKAPKTRGLRLVFILSFRDFGVIMNSKTSRFARCGSNVIRFLGHFEGLVSLRNEKALLIRALACFFGGTKTFTSCPATLYLYGLPNL